MLNLTKNWPGYPEWASNLLFSDPTDMQSRGAGCEVGEHLPGHRIECPNCGSRFEHRAEVGEVSLTTVRQGRLIMNRLRRIILGLRLALTRIAIDLTDTAQRAYARRRDELARREIEQRIAYLDARPIHHSIKYPEGA